MAKRDIKPNARPDGIGEDIQRLAPHGPWTLLAAVFAPCSRLISRCWAMPLGQAMAAINVIRTGPYLLHYPRRIPSKTTNWQRFME
jgi:hypothetical protein